MWEQLKKIWRDEPLWFVDIFILLQEELEVDQKWINQSSRPGSEKKDFVAIDVEPLLELLDPWKEDQWRHNILKNSFALEIIIIPMNCHA